ncbi:MAG TPA: hypothetical protein VD735_07535 [Candidatus Saccharimonadales bacterium]|nr:hypothetical protein [Candidatus Saccharimonadales bacterium]
MAPAASAQNTQGTPQPYNADTNIPIGTIVQLNKSDTKKVEAASLAKLNDMFGAVVNPDSLAITVTGAAETQKYVATDGKYNVLVTNENGVIKNGDNITLSNLKGTAMKASIDQEIIFGKALQNFDGKSNVIGQTNLKYDNGKAAKPVAIGLIQVAIDIKHNPEVRSTKTKLPPQLERLGEQIAEKELSPFRLYLSVAIVLIAVVIATVVLYSGIRSSILAIGRNPLSKGSVIKGLIQVILSGFIILIIGLFTVYLLLKL